MSGALNLEKYIPKTRRAFGLGLALALGVLAATILSGVLFVRAMAREQIARRDAEALYATTLMEQLDEAVPDAIEIRDAAEIGFDAAVRSSRLRGVMGIQFYDADGRFSDTFPATVMPRPLEPELLAAMTRLEARGEFLPDARMTDLFIYLPEFSEGRVARVPILLVAVPLHQRDSTELAGVARFIVEGSAVAGEYALLDRRLATMAGYMFLASGALLTAMLWPVFRRVRRLNAELAHHGDRLQRANDELALAARVSAVGAISAHLMHGLKNPLASLSEFVSSHDAASAEDRDDALTAARRMRALVERTVEVLGEADGGPTYELTVGELGADVLCRVGAAADENDVVMDFEAEGNCRISSRVANLAGLILVNLLENAVEATPAGRRVALRATREDEWICFRVRDEGPGFPEPRRDTLFLPGTSAREGGSGVGLAISKQIADYLGATLELEESTVGGCVFVLKLSKSSCLEPPEESGWASSPNNAEKMVGALAQTGGAV